MPVSIKQWQDNLQSLKAAVRNSPESRIRLNTHLKEFISRIEIFAKGHEDNVEHAEELLDEQFADLKRSSGYQPFRAYLAKRLLSSDGRFWTMHFHRPLTSAKVERKPDAGIALAPADSLAWRVEVNGAEMKAVGPHVGKLLKEFFDGRKEGFVAKARLTRP